MILLAIIFASFAAAWNQGACDEGGTVWQPDGADIFYCRNTCSFDWIGRGSKAFYREFGKRENGFLAQLSTIKWGLPYLAKEEGYIGILRFDRAYCKRAIL